MPITVNQNHWRNVTRTTTVSFEGETATVGFYPNRITPDMITRVTSSKDDITVLCLVLTQVVATWDVLGTPEPPADAAVEIVPVIPRQVPTPVGMYPLEVWALTQLPMAFISAVTEAVFGAAVPNSQRTAGTSLATS